MKKFLVMLEVTPECEERVDSLQVSEWIQKNLKGCDLGEARVCLIEETDSERFFDAARAIYKRVTSHDILR